MKQETLEKVAKKYQKDFGIRPNQFADVDFEAGAKWQRERSYSEEDLRKAFDAGYKNEFGNYFRYWFEEFKKK